MSRRRPDIEKLAHRQRWIIWLMLAAILLQFLPLLGMGQFGIAIMVVALLAQLVIYVLLIVGVILLLTAQGNHIAITVLCGILMAAPCVNLLVLVAVNMSVTRTLRRAGLSVGFMGVKPDDLERVLRADLCTKCGYNLTGNVSGRCPECGEKV